MKELERFCRKKIDEAKMNQSAAVSAHMANFYIGEEAAYRLVCVEIGLIESRSK